jgi:DNA replication protein DnaC
MSNQMAQLQEATIKAHCETLRMSMIASQFGTLAEQAIREKKRHVGYLEALLLAEVEERERNTIERRIREAHLPRVMTLEEFDYTQSPNVTPAKMRDLVLAKRTRWAVAAFFDVRNGLKSHGGNEK